MLSVTGGVTSAPSQEDVGGGAFGDVAVLGEEDGFVEAVAAGLVAGERAVDVGAADFRSRGDGVVVHPAPGAHAGVQALAAVEVVAEGQRHDGKRILVVRMHADARRRLVGQRADVEVRAEAVAPHQFAGQIGQRRCRS
jgi:hypothetical protein